MAPGVLGILGNTGFLTLYLVGAFPAPSFIHPTDPGSRRGRQQRVQHGMEHHDQEPVEQLLARRERRDERRHRVPRVRSPARDVHDIRNHPRPRLGVCDGALPVGRIPVFEGLGESGVRSECGWY